jgi:hypothetical protein
MQERAPRTNEAPRRERRTPLTERAAAAPAIDPPARAEAGRAATARSLLRMQRTQGNQHVQRVVQKQTNPRGSRAPAPERALRVDRYPVALPPTADCDTVLEWLGNSNPHAPAWALTSPNYSYRAPLTARQIEGASEFAVTVSRGTVTLQRPIRVDMPNWRPQGRAMRRAWRAMWAQLRAHEREHERIAREWRVTLQERLAAFTVTVSAEDRRAAERDARAELEAQWEAWGAEAQAAQTAIDPPDPMPVLDCAPPTEEGADTGAIAPMRIQRSAHAERSTSSVAADRAKPRGAHSPEAPLTLARSPATDLRDAHVHGLFLDRTALGEELLEIARGGNVQLVEQVFDGLSFTQRDDVAAAFVRKGARTPAMLSAVSRAPRGLGLLSRLYDELTSGAFTEAEEAEDLMRIITLRARRGDPDAIDPSRLLVFPFELGGPTNPNGGGMRASVTRDGQIRVELLTRFFTNERYRAERETLPVNVFLSGGIVLPPDRVVAVRLYDARRQVVVKPALFLVELSNQTTVATIMSIASVAGLALAVTGGAALTGRALMFARVATAYEAGSILINDHRGWILEEFPESEPYLRAWDVLGGLMGVWGVAQAARALPGWVRRVRLRERYRSLQEAMADWRPRNAEQRRAIDDLTRNTESILENADELAASTRPGPAGGVHVAHSAPRAAGQADGASSSRPRQAAEPSQRTNGAGASSRSESSSARAGPQHGEPQAVNYDSLSYRRLRDLARTDSEAAERLFYRLRRMSDKELRRRAAQGDEGARAVLRQRTPSNEADLRRALGSDYRPPHSADVTVSRGQREVWRRNVESGGELDAHERAIGNWRSRSLATHTEARAVRQFALSRGDHMTIMGTYDPCSRCVSAMTRAAREAGATITYRWIGGSRTFR